MKKKLISVIVPVYNVENYLDKCIESICKQEYKNIEIILIDDGSTDNSGLICDKWKNIDNRIKVIHKNNGGLSSARNCGLDFCTGDYIGFVDSDDSIMPDMYSTLLKNMDTYNAEISICWFKKVDEAGNRINALTKKEISIYSHDEAMELLVVDDVITSHSCNKLFSHSLWKKTRFPKDLIYEDIAIMHEVFNKTTSVVLTTQQQYIYLIRSDSVSYKTDTKRDYGLFFAFYKRYNFYNMNIKNESLIQQCLAKTVIEGFGAVYRMNYYRKSGYKEAISDIQLFYKQNISKIISCKALNHKQKMKVGLITYLFPLYKIVCVIYRKAKQ